MTTLWLIDRSRRVDGCGFCPRARLLNYHIGPNGYGLQMKATKVPLMSGLMAHDGLAPILEWCRDHPQYIETPPDLVIRQGVQQALEKYGTLVKVRGYAYLGATEEVMSVLREQQYLIEGLIWAWCLEVLPEILKRGQVVEVEVDDTYVFGCTCGLGDGIGSKSQHEERDCEGMGLMCRPDFLILTRLTQELEYHEFKTTSMDSITFRDKWEVMIQMFAATLDAERRLQKHVQSIYIHGLIKGKREGDYNPATGKRDGAYRQSSIFCYGYRKPAMPPMEPEQWAGQYEWQDEWGKNHRLGKTFQKAGVWELPDHYMAQAPDMSKAEFWAKWLPPEARKKALIVLGPFSRQTLMVDHFLQEVKGDEERWQAGLWELYECALNLQETAQTADYWTAVWGHPQFQGLMNKLFPRSYECRRYGGRNRCQFETPCFFREGWADPIGSGFYIERRPHHRDELEQAITRGLLLPEEGEAEDVEYELP